MFVKIDVADVNQLTNLETLEVVLHLQFTDIFHDKRFEMQDNLRCSMTETMDQNNRTGCSRHFGAQFWECLGERPCLGLNMNIKSPNVSEVLSRAMYYVSTQFFVSIINGTEEQTHLAKILWGAVRKKVITDTFSIKNCEIRQVPI